MVSVPCEPDGSIDAKLVEWMFHVTGNRVRKGWQVQPAICRDRPVVSSRNRIVKAFLDSDCDVLLTVDADQIPQIGKDEAGGLDLLLAAIERDDVDIVNAITVRRTDSGPLPVINKMTGEYSAELHTDILSRPKGLHELTPDGVMGGAGIMVKRRVLEKFYEESVAWFRDVFVWDKGKKFDETSGKDLYGERLVGHDVWFFLRAAELGFRSWVDTRVFWGHVKAADLRAEFNREIELLQNAKDSAVTPLALYESLRQSWGNEQYSAPSAFLARMSFLAKRLPDDEMCVECGSGLTTLLLKNLLPRDRVIALEQDRVHHEHRLALMGGVTVDAPLESKGDYDWYKFDHPHKPVGLVVCDGPRGDTRGGRYGALPQLHEYLADKFTILVDDVHRDAERAMLSRWADEYGVVSRVMDAGDGRAFAIVEGTKQGT